MFDKFGEMSSYTEINELAANLLQEGDLDSLKELAKENGVPDDYVEMYLEEAIPSLCDSTSAATLHSTMFLLIQNGCRSVLTFSLLYIPQCFY